MNTVENQQLKHVSIHHSCRSLPEAAQILFVQVTRAGSGLGLFHGVFNATTTCFISKALHAKACVFFFSVDGASLAYLLPLLPAGGEGDGRLGP